MTPLFFRGSVLIIENIISYDEFMAMPYKDFKRIEATWLFKNQQSKSRGKKQDKEKVKANLSKVPARSVRELGFSEEQLNGIFGNS